MHRDIRLMGKRKINSIEAKAILEYLNIHIDLTKVNKESKYLSFKIAKTDLEDLAELSEDNK